MSGGEFLPALTISAVIAGLLIAFTPIAWWLCCLAALAAVFLGIWIIEGLG